MTENSLLYRIIDFFELIALAHNRRLRVSSAARFSDSNEMIGVFFAQIDDPAFHPYTQEGMDKLIIEHTDSKESVFVSSWTRARDSIAMWELYSPYQTSVQIAVQHTDVQKAFEHHSEIHSHSRSHHAPPENGEVYFLPPSSGACEYVDFQLMHDRVAQRFQEFYERVKSLPRSAFNDAYAEFVKSRAIGFAKAFLYKNRAYEHEQEYRFVLQARTRNDREYLDCKNDPFFILFDTHLRSATKSDVGENVFIDFDPALIQEVRLDGRGPEWRIDIQWKLLRDQGFNVSISPAYGSFFDAHNIRPLRD